jgi:gliding motility-associated protein GldM
MAGAKETPRQKMIGMMYLVLTCLLALNVSKEVLQGFVTINENIETTNSNFSNNTSLMLKAFDDAIKNGHPEVKGYYEKAKLACTKTQKTYDYIEILKQQVKQYTEAVSCADTMRLANIEKLDDYDKPTFFLLGDDEAKPKTGTYSANELRNEVNGLASELNLLINTMTEKDGLKLPEEDAKVLREQIKLFTPTDNYFNKEGERITWETRNFYHMPLAAVITNLSKIQSDIRNIEAELVNKFASASGKLSINFNSYQARIVPTSQYVQTGNNYEADVFLSATSTEFKDDNIQFILGDVDTTSGNLMPGAEVLPIKAGNGKIAIPAVAIGKKEIKGWIKFKNGMGKFQYFPYQNEYVVANSAVAVSADKMNVLYIGADNDLSISAAGIAPTEMVVVGSGCGINLKNTGSGKYIAKVSTTGTCSINVYERTANGNKLHGAPKLFKVKKFPTPPVKLLGRPCYGTIDIPASEVKLLSSIGVDLSMFDFNVPFKIIKYNISLALNNKLGDSKTINGNNLNGVFASELSKIKKGDKVYIEDIVVMGPDGQRNMGNVKINVK